MKKLLLLLLLWLPVNAMAVPDTPYPADTMLYYPLLTQPQQAVFDLAYQAACQGLDKVELPPATAYDDAMAAMDALMLDCPELCALDGQYSITYFRDQPQEAVAVQLRYVMPAACQVQLVQRAAQWARQASGDDFYREWQLHDLLCGQVTYDLTADNQHNAWGALMEGRAVCDGYARGMALLLRLAGIECGVVQGKLLQGQSNHAWNLVNIGGAYTWLDATNNDQAAGITYFHFNLTDEWLQQSYALKGDHTLPACWDEQVNWHVKNYRMVESTADMEMHIYNNYRNLVGQGAMFNLRFRNQEDYLSLRDGVSDWAEKYNHLGGERVEGTLHTLCSDEQRCVIVQLLPAQP